MKYLWVLFLVGFARANQSDGSLPVEKEVVEELVGRIVASQNSERIIANDIVDAMLEQISKFMVEHDADPASLPYINLGFEYQPVIVTHHGELNLSNGNVRQMSSIRRNGDAVVSYGLGTATFNIPIGFEALQTFYDYDSLLMYVARYGSVEGKVEDIVADAEIRFDLFRMEAELTGFELKASSLSLEFSGNVLSDRIINLFVRVVNKRLEKSVIKSVEIVMRDILEQVIGMINGIPGILP